MNAGCAATGQRRPGDPRGEALYGVWRDYWPEAREYEKKTDRQFPVVRLQVPPSA